MKLWSKRSRAGLTGLAVCLALCWNVLPAQAITVEQMRALLEERYVDEVPPAALEQDTVEATVAALGDPYSEYLPKELLELYLNTDVDERVVGIGVSVQLGENGIEVVHAEEGGPAAEAGLEAGDVLVSVNGVSLAGKTLEEAAALIRGEEGTSVTLTYRRGGRRRTVTVERRTVVMAATRGQLLEGGLGYIRCDEFGSDTAGHFRDLIAQMDSEANVWVIDLRGNPGGTVDAVSGVGSLFAGPGAYIVMRDKSGEYAAYGLDQEAVTDKPVVILTDENSASASEALTAALRDYGRAMVVGERTFGKGIAQDILWDEQYPEYFVDGDGVKLTTARFFAPYGNTNDSLGVIPDLNVSSDLALEMVKQLAPTWSETEAEDPLLFALSGTWYTVELAGRKGNAEARAALKALLDALPRYTTMARGGSFVDMADIYAEFGLKDGHWVFPDGDDGTVCDASIYDALYTYDLVAGKEDGLFHPADPLTRAELCQLVAVALQCYVPDNPSPFADVADDAWYAPAVIALSNRGMVKGDGNGLFHPEEAVSHQEFFTVMGRLFAWLNSGAHDALTEVSEAELSLRLLREYDDWAKAQTWLLSCAAENSKGGTVNLLWDEPDLIDPCGETTRDEAAAVLYQMLNYLGML